MTEKNKSPSATQENSTPDKQETSKPEITMPEYFGKKDEQEGSSGGKEQPNLLNKIQSNYQKLEQQVKGLANESVTATQVSDALASYQLNNIEPAYKALEERVEKLERQLRG